MKRNDDEIPETDEVSKSSALTTEAEGHSHLIILNGPPDGVELNAGETSFQNGHDHPWVRGNGGQILIGVAQGPEGRPHTHDIGAVSKQGPEAIHNVGNTEDETMKTDDTKKADELQAAIERATKAEGELEAVKAYSSLTDAQKSYHDGLDAQLDDDKRKDFLAKSADNRQKVLDEIEAQKKLAEDGKQEIYKAADGTVYTAADDARLVAQAKRNDDLEKRLAKSEDETKDAAYRKRAETELGHLPGTIETRVALLKSVDRIEDETERTAALDTLKAQDAGMAPVFKTNGVQVNAQPTSGSAEDKLDTLAKTHAEAEKVSFAKAYDEVIQSDEGRKLYAEVTGDDQFTGVQYH
jgi:hypothetical protein